MTLQTMSTNLKTIEKHTDGNHDVRMVPSIIIGGGYKYRVTLSNLRYLDNRLDDISVTHNLSYSEALEYAVFKLLVRIKEL